MKGLFPLIHLSVCAKSLHINEIGRSSTVQTKLNTPLYYAGILVCVATLHISSRNELT